MPTELPGFYFDSERNRYFPISHRRKQLKTTKSVQEVDTSRVQSSTSNSRKDILELVYKRELIGQSTYFQRQFLEAHAAQPRVWEYGGGNSCFDGALEQVNLMLQTSNGLTDSNFLLAGGSNGRLGIYMTTGCDDSGGMFLLPRQCLRRNSKLQGGRETILPKVFQTSWASPFYTGSEITSIKALTRNPDLSSRRFIMTSLGSGESGGTMHLMHLNGQNQTRSSVQFWSSDCSFWASDCNYDRTKACIGTSKGVCMVDLERRPMTWICHSKSDCLSQKFLGNIIYAGFRNGYIYPFDIRESPLVIENGALLPSHRRASRSNRMFTSKGNNVFFSGQYGQSSKSKAIQMGSAVCSLEILPLDDRYLLASAMNSHICLWDLRMPTQAVQYFEGHKNTHMKLGMGIDPRGMLLTSGGEDSAVRIWSVPSGRLLYSQRGGSVFSPMTTVCWHTSYYGGRDGAKDDYAWSLWLGSFEGLFLMHGAVT